MKIMHKLILGFLTFTLIAGAAGYFSINLSEGALIESIGKEHVFLAERTLYEINKEIYNRIEEIQVYSADLILQEAIMKSNQEFDALDDIQRYINKKDDEWTSVPKETVTSFMQNLIENKLAEELREKIEFYEKKYGNKLYGEIFVTNKYGANVAQTGKTTDYYQADEEWWQTANETGLYVGDVGYDESADIYSIDIGVKIIDEDGNLLGVTKAVLSLIELIEFVGYIKEYIKFDTNFLFYDRDQKLIYSTKEFSIFDDAPEQYHRIIGITGFTVIHEEGEEEEVYSYAVSQGFRDFEGLGWTLLIESETEDILAPVIRLKNTLFITLAFVIVLSILTGIGISRSIFKPIGKLSTVAEKIGRGDLDSKAEVSSKDEIGNLAVTINHMASDLKKYQNKLLESEKKRGKELELEVSKKTKELNRRVNELEIAKKATTNMLEDLNEANKELKTLDQAKSNFLNLVSHELKTPLTAVFAHLGVLDDFKKDLSKEELKSLDAIKRNSNQLKILINNILEIARIEAGKFELNPTKLDIKKEIHEVVENLSILSNKKGLKIEVEAKELPSIIADEIRVKEILTNLISNAIKFTNKGKITIKAVKDGKFVKTSVIDTGVGISKDKIKNLFQKFYQVDSSVSRRFFGGTGLGLSISKQLVELQKGKISVESEPGKGSTFSFTLPIHKRR